MKELKDKKEISAVVFLKELKEKDKYKLVNGLFIVKYINKNESLYIGDFLKSNSARNKVLLINSEQKFNKEKNLTTTGLGFWKELNISFKEQPIDEILK